MTKTKKILVIMDPIESIKPYKDTSFALLLEAQARNYQCYYCQPNDLYIKNNITHGLIYPLSIQDTEIDYFSLSNPMHIPLSQLDIILMRCDPPVNQIYIQTTFILERAQQEGVLVLNNPVLLRNKNEKLFALDFPDIIPDTLISNQANLIKQFLDKYKQAILKPINGMGGDSVFYVKAQDPNLNVIIETLSNKNKNLFITQEYIPEIKTGDKRIILIDGEIMDYGLLRIPLAGESRGNLAAGGQGKVFKLSKSDLAIAKKIQPTIKSMGLMLVGMDIIGDKLTEINITSPTCLREIMADSPLNLTKQFFDGAERRL